MVDQQTGNWTSKVQKLTFNLTSNTVQPTETECSAFIFIKLLLLYKLHVRVRMGKQYNT